MSRSINLAELTEEDVPFLIQMPWLVKQAEHEGHEVPESFYELSQTSAPHPGTQVTELDLLGRRVETGKNLGEDELEEDDGIDHRSYIEMSNKELKQLLEERDLSTSGSKQEMADRLEEYDLSEEEEDDESEEDESDEDNS